MTLITCWVAMLLVTIADSSSLSQVNNETIVFVKKICQMGRGHEGDIAQKVCQVLQTKYPQIPAEQCQTAVVEELKFMEMFCLHEDFAALSMPDAIIDDIMKVIKVFAQGICQMEKGHEGDIAQKVCQASRTQFPQIPAEMCQTAVVEGLQELEKLCPHEEFAALSMPAEFAALSMPDSITDGDIAQKVCQALHTKVPQIPVEQCQADVVGLLAVVRGLIEQLLSMPDSITDGDIAQKVCQALHTKVPQIPVEQCQADVVGLLAVVRGLIEQLLTSPPTQAPVDAAPMDAAFGYPSALLTAVALGLATIVESVL